MEKVKLYLSWMVVSMLLCWVNAPPEPDRSATRFVLLPLLPSGSDGVHRGPPCGARPGRHLGSTAVEIGIETGSRNSRSIHREGLCLASMPATLRAVALRRSDLLSCKSGEPAKPSACPFYPRVLKRMAKAICFKTGGERGIRTLGTIIVHTLSKRAP